MISRYRVSLDNHQLDELEGLEDTLMILDVGYSPVEKQIHMAAVPNLDGYDVTNTRFNSRTVTVTFELHIYDTAERNAACQRINEWAQNGGILRVNDREGQFLSVVCQQLATVGSVRNWTDPISIVFVTTGIPFWQSEDLTTVTVKGKSTGGTLKLDGNTGYALVSVDVTANATVNSFQVKAGGYTLTLKDFTIYNGQKLVIDYISGRFLRIRANGSNIMSKLNPASSDNLKAKCGANTAVSFTAGNTVTAVFTARGLWL